MISSKVQNLLNNRKKLQTPVTQPSDRASTSQSCFKRVFSPALEKQFQLDFYQAAKNLQKKNVFLTSRRKPKKIEQDPLQVETPIDQVNQFRIVPYTKLYFQEYLDGSRSAQQLINDCNFKKTILTENHKQEMRKRKKTKIKDAVKIKEIFFNNLEEKSPLKSDETDDLKKQQRQKKRINVFKKLISDNNRKKKIQTAIVVNQYQLIDKLDDAIQQYTMKIKQGDLTTARSDGINKYDQLKYAQTSSGGVRKRIDEYQFTKSQTKSEVKVQTINQAKALQQEVKIEAEQYLENLHQHSKARSEENFKKIKLQLIKNRKLKNQQSDSGRENDSISQQKLFKEYHEMKGYKPFKEPYFKDIKLYEYLYDRKPDYQKFENHTQSARSFHVPISRQIQRFKPKATNHLIRNFEKDIDQDENFSDISDDSQDVSILEAKLSQLYQQSNNVQKYMLTDQDKLGFHEKIFICTKLNELSKQINKVNEDKLAKQ